MKGFVGYIFIIVLTLIGAYYLWSLGKRLNYSFKYRDMVVETIEETVKKECLK